eukprot:TRINITY_DN2330_c0_g1_i1.p1 TRINITY_DN2330_c0_g1~~TRINITY_DN2330_c0_g1_i1.p1  ORF type:complete len:186 (-),score=25.21 TRINITY_DN2330_c0_g1_i1:53-610(-)
MHNRFQSPSIILFFKELKPQKTPEAKSSLQNVTFEVNLPEKGGLRKSLLKMIFDKLSSKDTLKMGLVNKEWYAISRDNVVWKSHFERDYPYLFNEVKKDLILGTDVGRFKIVDAYIDRANEITLKDLKLYLQDFSLEHYDDPFIDFWNFRDHLLFMKADSFYPQYDFVGDVYGIIDIDIGIFHGY